MAKKIVPHVNKSPNKTYYYYQHSYREKINPGNSDKNKGSGKSKVITDSIYLGTAENIVKAVKESRFGYYKAKSKNFGLPVALWEIADQIKLPQIIDKNIPKDNSRYPISTYLIIAAINRVCDIKPKEQFPKWLKGTPLPEYLGINPKLFNSQNYWNNYELVVSEKEAKAEREYLKKIKNEEKRKAVEYTYLTNTVINEIEKEIANVLIDQENVNLDCILYDNTNFYTYIDKLTDSLYAANGYNKEGRHNLKQVTLSTAVTEDGGLPIFHMLYKGNLPDVKIFPEAITQLINRLENYYKKTEKINIIIDKGNNSATNLDKENKNKREYLKNNKISLIGSLKPSEYEKYLRKNVKSYPSEYKKEKYYYMKQKVYGSEKLIVVKFNSSTYKRQYLTFIAELEKLKKNLKYYFNNLKTKNTKEIKKLEEMVKNKFPDSKLKYIIFEIKEKDGIRKINIRQNRKEIRKKKIKFGKTILFTDNLRLSPEEIIDKYKSISVINEDHKILKGEVKFRPFWHWTDSKIRVQSFVNIIGLLLIKMLEYRLKKSEINIKMNTTAIKNSLSDIKEVLMVNEKKETIETLTEMNTNQKILFELFNLKKYAPKNWKSEIGS